MADHQQGSEPVKVWVLKIDHKYDQDLYVFRTEEAANAELLSFVHQWWEDEMPKDRKMPDNDDDAIEQYFDYMADQGGRSEFYDMREVELGG